MPCSTGMRSCKADCLHRRLVDDYRTARLAAEQRAEHASVGYPTEYAEYLEQHPLITFKAWLQGHARPGEREQLGEVA